MTKPPTINDVAKLCGVTAATVSRVLNGKRNFSVSQEVRSRIEATAREVGYVPDLAARNLNRRQTRIVGVFAAPQTNLAEGINEMLLEGVSSVLHRAGYDVFLELTSADRQAHALPFWRFDGAIVMQAPKAETVAELDHRRVPYVCVNESSENALCNVMADDRMGMAKCLDHLHQLGHRRIAYVNARRTYLPHYSVALRYESLLSGVSERGMTLVAQEDAAPANPVEFLRQAVKDKATACITYDHHLAVTIVGAAAALNLRIPEDLSLIGFNDLFPMSILPTPVTAVAVDGFAIGRTGAELLLARLQANSDGKRAEATPSGRCERPVVWVPEDLVVRSSTAPVFKRPKAAARVKASEN